MTDCKISYFLATLCFALILPLYVSADDGSGVNTATTTTSTNCTVDADCPANWTCKKDPISAYISFDLRKYSMPTHYDSPYSDVAPACVGVPDKPSSVQVGFQSVHFFDNSVELELMWDGQIYPFNVYDAFVFIYSNDGNRGAQAFHSFGGEQTFKKKITGLKGSTNYSVYMVLASAAGSSPLYGPLNLTTIANPPGEVKNVKVVQDTKIATQMSLTFKCPDNLGAKITEIVVEKEQYADERRYRYISTREYRIPNVGLCLNDINATQVGGITVGESYRFKIKLQNEKYQGKYSDSVFLTVKDIAGTGGINSNDDKDNNNNNTSLIVGLAVGIGGTFLIVVCVAAFVFYRRSKRQRATI